VTITLATLPQATAQEVFDQIVEHLLTQREQSSVLVMRGADESIDCYYRYGPLKCAAGCLIADDEYRPDMENVAWGGIVRSGWAPGHHKTLIEHLQVIHDNYPPASWPYRISEHANRFGFTLSPRITQLMKEIQP